MKLTSSILLTIVFMTSLTSTALAQPKNKTHSGKAGYRVPYDYFGPRFSNLEQLGVLKAAENAAILKCESSGETNCVATSSVITSCNVGGEGEDVGFIICYAKAVARAIH